jgi:hypothetical protein
MDDEKEEQCSDFERYFWHVEIQARLGSHVIPDLQVTPKLCQRGKRKKKKNKDFVEGTPSPPFPFPRFYEVLSPRSLLDK